MRKDMVRTKQVLEEALGAHRDSVREVKDIESHIKVSIHVNLTIGPLTVQSSAAVRTHVQVSL